MNVPELLEASFQKTRCPFVAQAYAMLTGKYLEGTEIVYETPKKKRGRPKKNAEVVRVVNAQGDESLLVNTKTLPIGPVKAEPGNLFTDLGLDNLAKEDTVVDNLIRRTVSARRPPVRNVSVKCTECNNLVEVPEYEQGNYCFDLAQAKDSSLPMFRCVHHHD